MERKYRVHVTFDKQALRVLRQIAKNYADIRRLERSNARLLAKLMPLLSPRAVTTSG